MASHDLPPNLKRSIERLAQKEGFVTYEITSKNISTNGGSYMGILYEVDIKGKSDNVEKELNIFVKNIVENVKMKIYSVPEVFRRECFAYKDLSKIFTDLQEKANIPYNERFKMAKAYEECNPKSIILEHVGKRGFKVYNRMETISLEYAILCIKQLAKFHALSIVIEKNMPEFFRANIATLRQPYNFKDDWNGFVKNMYDFSINCLEPDVKKRVEEKILKKVDDYPEYMDDSTGLSTFCHGDYKHNNIMAKEVNGELADVLPVDFQILHIGCPVFDLVYFIFNGTDQEFRRNHLLELKNLYYKTMKLFLKYFGLELEKIFPREEFEATFKEKLDFGLMINVFYVPFLFAAEDDAPDVTNQSLSTLSFKVDKRFTERFRGVVEDFINWGYL